MTTNDEDDRLFRRAKNGDPVALGRLIERRRPWLHGIVSKKVHGVLTSRIDDIVQETILKAHSAFETLQGDDVGAFKKWMRTIAFNHIRDVSRQRVAVHGEFAEVPRGSTSPSGKVRKKEESEILLFHLNRLGPPQQEIVRLRYFEQLKFQEIADRLGLTLHVVTGHYRRGMERLGDAVRKTLGDGNSHA